MFDLDQKVIVSLNPGMWVQGVINKVSYTHNGRWYGVQVNNGPELHGIVESALTLV